MGKNFDAFIQDLRQEEIWNQYGPELAMITPGRWDYLVRWAKSKGYEFDQDDIRRYVAGQKLTPKLAATRGGLHQWDPRTLL